MIRVMRPESAVCKAYAPRGCIGPFLGRRGAGGCVASSDAVLFWREEVVITCSVQVAIGSSSPASYPSTAPLK